MSTIPEEMYHEILLRLPVKSLLVCKSVCKNWYALISTSDFVKSHLNLTFEKNNNTGLMLRCDNSISFYSLSYDSLRSLSSSLMSEFDGAAVELDYPMKSTCAVTQLVGSCNGLVCLMLRGTDDEQFFCLWNPATKEYKKIPKPPSIDVGLLKGLSEDYGFAYAVDDYRLVKLGTIYGYTDSYLSVYTLGSDSWEPVQSIPYSFRFRGVLVHGALHWLAKTRDGCNVVLALELSDPRPQEVQLPKEPFEKNGLFKCVGVLGGCLSALVNVMEPVGVVIEIWVMEDYGVRESWKKHHIIKNEEIQKYGHFCFGFMGYLKTGEILLKVCFDYVELALYHPEQGNYRVIIHRPKLLGDAENYVESLVSLNSGTFVGRIA